MMNRSDLHTARVLIFSGFIKDKFSHKSVPEIINNDSLKSIKKIDEIYRISSYVCNDTLMSKLIGQVYLEKNGDFILIPLLGDQKIIFGSAYSEQEINEKFDRLRVFYEEAMPYEGWDKYNEISVKYEGQIVCRKRR
jgi:cell division protein FtsQ